MTQVTAIRRPMCDTLGTFQGVVAMRTIQSPADMASLLRRSCQDDAAGFAQRTHRRACDNADDHWTEFWQGVVEILSRDG